MISAGPPSWVDACIDTGAMNHATAGEREEPQRPSCSIGRDTSAGCLWCDPAVDDVKIVDDLATIGMPPPQMERILKPREDLPPIRRP